MCGINLIVEKQQSPGAPHAILAMNQATRHRGPDYEDFIAHKTPNYQLFMGHTRLKILDLSEQANQPLTSPCGNYTLLFNGEIYNYRQLAKKLPPGYALHSTGDSEVLLYWLVNALEQSIPIEQAIYAIQGMFAIVLWDKKKQRLLIARDPQGIKPLYFSVNDTQLVISSEIRGVLASGHIPQKLHTSQVHHYLHFKYALRPNTFFEGIQEIEKPVFFELEEHQFHEISDYSPPLSEIPKFSLSSFEQLLLEALERHLQSDVPLGLFLSGGVDSTLLLALWSANHTGKIPVFTVVNQADEATFGTQDFYFAQKAAQQYRGELHEVPVDHNHLDNLPAFWASMDQPVADGGSYLTHLLSECAAKSVKVILSGAGADEWFAGYNRHLAFKRYLEWSTYLSWSFPALKFSASLLRDGANVPFRKQIRLYKKFAQQIEKTPEATWVNFMQLYTPHLREKEMDKMRFSGNFIKSPFAEALDLDRRYYLPQDILRISDEMSMRHHLELRVPFLDQEILRNIAPLQATYLLKHGKKWLLKKILKQHQGKVYTQRQKEGLGMPFGHWLRQNPLHRILSPLDNPQWSVYQFVKPLQTQKMLQMHLSGKADFSQELWALLALGYWLDAHFA